MTHLDPDRLLPVDPSTRMIARRLYAATAAGLAAVKAAREVVQRLWSGLDARLKEPLK